MSQPSAISEMQVVLGGFDPFDAPSQHLTFEETRTRAELPELTEVNESQLAGLLRHLRDDFGHTDNLAAFIGRYQQNITLIAPHFHQQLGLPIKLGEKVVWRINLPSVRFLPSAQTGVLAADNARELLKWLRISYPKLALVFTDLMTDSPLYAAITCGQILGYRITNNQPASHLFHCFRGSYEEFFSEKQSKYKNQLRKKEKIFREKFGTAFAIKEYRKVDEVPEFLEAADFINRKTYQFKLFGETVDNTPEMVCFYSELARQGTFRSFILWHDAIPLCFILGHQGSDGIFQHQKTGFDPQWRDYSPGLYCNILMLQRLYEIDRPVVLDFGSGDADYKRLFANKTGLSASPILMPQTFIHFFVYLIYSSSIKFNDTVVDFLDKIGIKDGLKRLIRRIT